MGIRKACLKMRHCKLLETFPVKEQVLDIVGYNDVDGPVIFVLLKHNKIERFILRLTHISGTKN